LFHALVVVGSALTSAGGAVSCSDDGSDGGDVVDGGDLVDAPYVDITVGPSEDISMRPFDAFPDAGDGPGDATMEVGDAQEDVATDAPGDDGDDAPDDAPDAVPE
jgi:hypothetical protein